MARWFKCLSPDHSIMKPIIDAMGWEGYGMACAVLSECYLHDITEIDEKHLRRWLGIYPKRALNILNLFQDLLANWLELSIDNTTPQPPTSPPAKRPISEPPKVTTPKPKDNLKGFDEFWQLYPKKRSKGTAERAWVKIKPDEQLHKIIIESLQEAIKSPEWQKENGKYIQHPATWLNAKAWEDQLDTTSYNDSVKSVETTKASEFLNNLKLKPVCWSIIRRQFIDTSSLYLESKRVNGNLPPIRDSGGLYDYHLNELLPADKAPIAYEYTNDTASNQSTG